MSKPGTGWACGWVGAVAFASVACGGGGGGAAGAKAPGACPEGTVLRGQDCLPDETAGEKPSGGSAASSGPAAADKSDKSDKLDEPAHPAPEPSRAPTESASDGKVPYMKDAVDVELKRGARQVKANCGSATDDEGRALGPWGRTKASITLGRNGHVKAVSVPDPYAGKPVAVCVSHAFDKIQFPPYSADSDAVVEWDIDIVRPKGK